MLEFLFEQVPHSGRFTGLSEILVPPISPSGSSAEESLHERRLRGRSRIARAATVAINETNAALVANLGDGGMRVQALGRPLQTGTKLRLQFQMPGSQAKIRLSGVVAWVNDKAEAGIRFTRLSRSLSHLLREGMARNGIANAALEFFRVAGSWQGALRLVSQVTRLLTGARGVALTITDQGPICAIGDEDLPIRSTVAAPIYASQRVVGHLEISSSELGAFDELTLSALPVLAALAGELIERRAAELRKPAAKTPGLSTRIADRIDAMLPTVRVRIVP